MRSRYDDPALMDRLASEYVVGSLQGGARRRFEALLRQRPAARRAMRAWEQRVKPEAGWPESSVAPASVDGRRRRGAAMLAAAGAGIAIGVTGMAVVLPSMQPSLVAIPADRVLPEAYAGFLSDATGDLTLLVSARRQGRTIDIKVVHPISMPAGHMLLLWAVFKDASPIAIGTVPSQGKSQLTLQDAAEPLLAKAIELAASIEPLSPLPPKQPSSPFVFRGPCAEFW